MKITLFMSKRNYHNNQIVLRLLDNLNKSYPHIKTESHFFESIYTLEKEKKIFGTLTITDNDEKIRLAVLSENKQLIADISGKDNIIEFINNINNYYKSRPDYQDRKKYYRYINDQSLSSDQKLISIWMPKKLK